MDYNVDALRICYEEFWSASQNSSEEAVEKIVFLKKQLSIDNVLWPVEITLCVVSTLVSLVNVIVLTRKNMLYSSLNVLLVALEITNIILAVCQLNVSTVRFKFGQYTSNVNVFLLETVSMVCTFTAGYAINWLTVVIGAWRFVAVTWPLSAAPLLTKQKATITIVILVSASLVPVVFFAVINEITNEDLLICARMNETNVTEVNHYFLIGTLWASSHSSSVDQIIVVINIVYYLLPCICFVVITIGLVWNICHHMINHRRLRQGQGGAYIEKGHIRTTVILTFMLSFFLASNTLPLVIRMIWLSGNDTSDNLYYFLTYTLSSYPLSLVTNSISFIAYYFMGTQFRDTFHALFRKSSDLSNRRGSSRYIPGGTIIRGGSGKG